MKKLLSDHNEIIKNLQRNLEEINRFSEGQPRRRAEETTAVVEAASNKSQSIAVQLKVIAARQQEAARDVHNEYRKNHGSNKRPATPSEMLFYQNQASLLRDMTPEGRIPGYHYLIGKLTPPERENWRYLFDDYLELLAQGDELAQLQIQAAIDQYRSPDEKAALRAMIQADRMAEYVPTIEGILKSNLLEASKGEAIANDPESVFDGILNDIEAETKAAG